VSGHLYLLSKGKSLSGSGSGSGAGGCGGKGPGPGSGGGTGGNPSKWNMSWKVMEPPAGNICDGGETPINVELGGPPALYWTL
jgi:hypothetical protein